VADIKVVVTPELVERATERDSRHCMIAEAIKEAHPHFRNILVDLATIRWTNPRTAKRYVCLTPEPAAQALVAFDQGEPIEPFTFNAHVIQATPTRGPTSEGAASNRGRKRLTVHSGQATIDGGVPIAPGHLRGSSASGRAQNSMRLAEREAAEPADGDSNVKRSGRRYRQYGRRLLQP
jgi:hypothetical protein